MGHCRSTADLAILDQHKAMSSTRLDLFKRAAPLTALLTSLIVAALLPRPWLAPLDRVGYALCHRIPQRSYFVAGRQLPVCARDTGMFGSLLLGVVLFSTFPPKQAGTARSRAARGPAMPYALVLGAGFAAWGIDGFNSYLQLLTGEPLLYKPQNWLRLTTGAWMGSALSTWFVSSFNTATWAEPHEVATVSTWRDLLRSLAAMPIVIGLTLWGADALYGPLAVLSAGGALVMLSVVNGLLLLVVLGRHAQHRSWRSLVLPMAAGVVLSGLQITALNLLRDALTRSLNLPF